MDEFQRGARLVIDDLLWALWSSLVVVAIKAAALLAAHIAVGLQVLAQLVGQVEPVLDCGTLVAGIPFQCFPTRNVVK